MKVYDATKTKILEDYDLSKGYLKEDYIEHNYPEVNPIEEQGHYEVIAEYPNGGKDVKWVVDVEGKEYQPARTEKEDIQVYVPYTKKELDIRFINEIIISLKDYLNNVWSWQWERYNAETVEIEMGLRTEYTKDKYTLIMDRKSKVAEINKLEEELKELNDEENLISVNKEELII